MKKKIILVAICSAFLWSCQQNHQDDKHDTATQETHQHDEKVNAIELDNGTKWLVNAEMKPFVISGEKLVNDFITKQGTTYMELAKNLTEQNDGLVKSCTMKGKSHDELHKWLHPHLELVEELSKTKDGTQAKAIVEKLKISYHTYTEYFN